MQKKEKKKGKGRRTETGRQGGRRGNRDRPSWTRHHNAHSLTPLSLSLSHPLDSITIPLTPPTPFFPWQCCCCRQRDRDREGRRRDGTGGEEGKERKGGRGEGGGGASLRESTPNRCGFQGRRDERRRRRRGERKKETWREGGRGRKEKERVLETRRAESRETGRGRVSLVWAAET